MPIHFSDEVNEYNLINAGFIISEDTGFYEYLCQFLKNDILTKSVKLIVTEDFKKKFVSIVVQYADKTEVSKTQTLHLNCNNFTDIVISLRLFRKK